MAMSAPLFEYLRKSLDDVYPNTFNKTFCLFKRPVESYKTMSTIFQVAGCETTEMNEAISDVETSVRRLKSVTEATRTKFLKNTTTDTSENSKLLNSYAMYRSIIPILGK